MSRALILAVLALTLAACRQPGQDDPDKPVEPQSTAGPTELRDALRQPIDQAKNAEADVQQAEQDRRAAIEAAEGG